ncbi:layilin isoform X2 [Labrus bergylta]|uniref:layilin isoform X2 n=1 Tax=Labrus bergylta TaxID=56723 RepID=UPI003314009B
MKKDNTIIKVLILNRLLLTKMDLLIIFCHLLLLFFDSSEATSLITGQRVCKAGKGKPCYKLAYFSELRRRLNFVEAELACRRDGGQLLSVESESEQKIIEQLITELRPTDGDFWIGLRRNHGNEDSSLDCSSQYYWLDGSKSTFRNWHWDEPSCGYEVCVVMYHQPSAPPGLGGLYMFQWNDDNCETKNNFICKYNGEKPQDPSPSPNSTKSNVLPSSVLPWNPRENIQDRSTVLKLVYIIIPTIPLILLLLTVTGVCCFKLLVRRRRKEQKSEVCQTEPALENSTTPTDVYNVIRSQKDDDLISARPNTKNTSFLCSSPDTPTGDYDNLGGRDTESGFVTLASTESCFLNFDLNDLSLGRRGTRDFYDTSLGRSGKRDLKDGGLSCTGHRDFYDRSLGRRTTKSEHYGSSVYGDHGLYDGSIRGGSDLYDSKLRPGSHTVKADLYQTYITNGKEDSFQTNLGTYGNRKSYQANLDCYRNGLNLDGGRRYFNEQDWINSRENY